MDKDKKVVLAAVRQDGRALEFAHGDLKKNRDVVLKAVGQNGLALEFAHEDLKKGREVVLELKPSAKWLCLGVGAQGPEEGLSSSLKRFGKRAGP